MASKFRTYVLSSGREVFAGRNAEENEKLVDGAGEKDILLHTAEAGSSFVNIGEKPGRKDKKEGAVFCAVYSRDWKKNKSDVDVHVFKKENVYKEKHMKKGTFGVKKLKTMKVKKKDIGDFKNETS